MQALRAEVTPALAYWTVVDDDWCPVPIADGFLRHLRLGRDRAEGTTKAYAGDLALFLGWCADSGRDLVGGAGALSQFVAMLRTTPVQWAGSGQELEAPALRGARSRPADQPRIPQRRQPASPLTAGWRSPAGEPKIRCARPPLEAHDSYRGGHLIAQRRRFRTRRYAGPPPSVSLRGSQRRASVTSSRRSTGPAERSPATRVRSAR